MSRHHNPSEPFHGVAVTSQRGSLASASEWRGSAFGGPTSSEEEGIQWTRYFDVLKRHALLIFALAIAGSASGYFATRRIKPVYEAQATVWINAPSAQQSGPIRAQQLMPSASWIELLRSFAIVDPVVRTLNLNVIPKQSDDSVAFRNFRSGERIIPGLYRLAVDSLGTHYELSTLKGLKLERGVVGDSVGRSFGFKWVPDHSVFTPGKTINFSVTSVRAMSVMLLANLRTSLPDQGQFLRMTLSGPDPHRTALTVNTWAAELVRSSGELKARHLLEFKKTLEDQLSVAATQLNASETQLEQFRVNTITLPSAHATPAAGPAPADPVVSNFFAQKVALDEARDERIALEQIMDGAKGGAINPQAFMQLPGILNATPQLRAAIEELSSRQAALRTEQQYLTDANPRIKQLAEAVRALEQETIPRITLGVLAALRAREPELSSRVAAKSQELRAIPTRATEEMRLVRQVVANENLYNSLKARYEEVSMAEAQSAPDLSVLDVAAPPQFPNSDDGARILLLAALASIGLAVGLALLHDRMDKRVRYPEHATRDLGLLISGTVPKFKPKRGGSFQLETMAQAVESFRTLRLAIRYDFPTDAPVSLTVSSPSAGDGKSLVSSNLALTFASSGSRTLLIDGDVRRGSLHSTFDVPVTPGLVEYLHGKVGLDDIIRPTTSENLFVIARGARHNRSPELLVSDLMSALVLAVRRQFDVIIIDSPPLIAGIDAYALAAAAGSMLIVLRPGVTDRRLAAAKLEVVDRLPIRVLGAVLNAVPNNGSYQYYGNDYNYSNQPSSPGADLATPGGLVLQA